MKDYQKEFINSVAPGAIAGWHSYKILPSVTIAQAIVESGWGRSGLTAVSNNLFGIKGSYNGEYCDYPTREYINGKYRDVSASFKKYPTRTASIMDHTLLLGTKSRYSNIVGCTDYKQACRYLQSDGYATSPNYADSLIKIIDIYNLTEYDPPYNNVEFYQFTTGPITKGDVDKFIELAETLQLHNYTFNRTEETP